MATIVQIANKISKGIAEYGFIKLGKNRCKNEQQTKKFLIEPFMNLLGYNNLDLIPEYQAYFGSKKDKRWIDYAIKITNKEPEIIIEAKKFGEKLDKHTFQLNEYFINTSSSKIDNNNFSSNWIFRDHNKRSVFSFTAMNKHHSEVLSEIGITSY